jgi:hypothetical protein
MPSALVEANANERKEGSRVSGYNIVKLAKMFNDAKISGSHVLVDDSENDDLTMLEMVIRKHYSVAVLRNFAIRYTAMTTADAKKIPKQTSYGDGLRVKSRGMAYIVAEYVLEHHNDMDYLEYLRSLIDAPVDV